MEGRKMIRKIVTIFTVLAMIIGLTSCSFVLFDGTTVKRYEESSEVVEKEEKIIKLDWEEALELADEYLSKMSLEEKVGQVFMLNLEQLDRRKGIIMNFANARKPCRRTLQNTMSGA